MKTTTLLRQWFPLLIVVDAAVVDNSRRLRSIVASQIDTHDPELPKMPKANNPFVPLKEGSKRRMMNAINKFRAEICYRMKVENGVDFGTYENCEKFMKKACRPGRDIEMDGDRKEITSGEGYCREFFPEAERKAKEQIEEEDKAAALGTAPAGAPVPAMPVGIVAPAPAAPEKPDAIAAPAPAPPTKGKSMSAAPSDTDPKFTPGISSGKPSGKLGDDESYYYKKDGKAALRLHMDEDLKLPTQGYWGKLVSHDDMETATGDWGVEFGSKANLGSYESHCRKYCDNEWCIRQGYCISQHKSGVAKSTNLFASMLLSLILFVIV